MSVHARDYLPLLEEAIAEARAAGLGAQAHELESATILCAFTTSNEMFHEHGIAIRRFLQATRKRLPAATREKLKTCLNESQLSSTGLRGLFARLRRPDVLG